MKKIFQIFAVVGIFLGAGLMATYAQAQSTGLGINPRKDYTIAAGKSVSDTLYISNLNADIAVTVTLSIIDFTSADETGTPSLLTAANASQTAWSLKPFLNIPESITLEPGESKYVPFSISIPDGQGAGSYYSAIKYDPQSANGSGNLNISGAPTQLIFVTVPGKTTQFLNLVKFGAYNMSESQAIGAYRGLFITSAPKQLAYTLENRGNVAESPAGSIIIKDIFGHQVRVIEDANPKASTALIGQTRRFDVCIEPKTQSTTEEDGSTTKETSCGDTSFLPGIYRAELNLLYGLNGNNTQEIRTTAVFWYLPWWFIAIIVFVIGLLAAGVVWLRQRLLGKKRHVRKR